MLPVGGNRLNDPTLREHADRRRKIIIDHEDLIHRRIPLSSGNSMRRGLASLLQSQDERGTGLSSIALRPK